MKMRRNFPMHISAQARPTRTVPAPQAASVRKGWPNKRWLQPPRYPSSRIDDLLGDFSEQTGATFG